MMDANVTNDQDFILYIVKQLVTKPEEVKIERTIDERGVLLTLTVAREDMGKVIGKDGQTAKALRVLLRVVGSKTNARINLKIVDQTGGGESSSGVDVNMNLAL